MRINNKCGFLTSPLFSLGRFRALLLFAMLLLFGGNGFAAQQTPVKVNLAFAAAEKSKAPLSISPIVFSWDKIGKVFKASYTVYNRTSRRRKLSVIVTFLNDKDKWWRGAVLPTLKPHSSRTFVQTLPPKLLLTNGWDKISAVLYKGRYKRAVANTRTFELKRSVVKTGNKVQLELYATAKVKKKSAETKKVISVGSRMDLRFLLKFSEDADFSFKEVDAATVTEEPKEVVLKRTPDTDILIFSNTHGAESYLKRTKGMINLEITTYAPIIHIDVNGQPSQSFKHSIAEIYHPYHLIQKRTEVTIDVYTTDGMASKTFVLFLGAKPKPKPNPLQIITIMEASSLDNVNNTPADQSKIAAQKSSLILLANYSFGFGEADRLKVGGLLLREKYAKVDYQAKEISFSQLSTEWSSKGTSLGDLAYKVGANDIRTANKSMALGSNPLMKESFLAFAVTNEFGKDDSIESGIEIKKSDLLLIPATPDDDGDGQTVTLKFSGKSKTWGLKHKAKLRYALKDTVGRYQDSSTLVFGYGLGTDIGPFASALDYAYNSTENKTSDYRSTAAGFRLSQAWSSVTLKLDYKLSPTLVLSLKSVAKTQESNLAASTYKSGTQSASLTMVF